MAYDGKQLIRDDKPHEFAKSYAKPSLEKRAKLTDVTEGTAVVIPVSGVINV